MEKNEENNELSATHSNAINTKHNLTNSSTITSNINKVQGRKGFKN